jgi:hypothetical protein
MTCFLYEAHIIPIANLEQLNTNLEVVKHPICMLHNALLILFDSIVEPS